MLEARCIPGTKFLRRNQSLAKISGGCLQNPTEIAEAAMNTQPELDSLAEIGMRRPNLARETIEEKLKIVRPPGAGIKIKVHDYSQKN